MRRSRRNEPDHPRPRGRGYALRRNEPMTLRDQIAAEMRTAVTRRWFFRECGVGLGAVALHSLFQGHAVAAPADPMAPKQPHFPAKAKNVIFLFMAGAPSHLELFDN